ncbi:MAG: response regulator [Clostridiales Family XIII bacterium]|jgi:PAS domain S-box-containing protein|nr:response regulator [Clostridiales Family XIII bacterium]
MMELNPPKRVPSQKIFNRVIALSFVAIIAMATTVFFIFQSMSTQFQQITEEQYDTSLNFIYKETLTDTLKYINQVMPVMQDTQKLKDESKTDWFWEQTDELVALKETFGYAYIYYIERQSDGGYIFLMSADLLEDKNPEQLLGPVWQGDTPGFIEKAWQTGEITYSEQPTVNEWGSLISAAMPIKNGDEVVGVLGVDYDVSFLNSFDKQKDKIAGNLDSANRTLLISLTVLCALAIAIMFYLLRIARRTQLVSNEDLESNKIFSLMTDASPLASAWFDEEYNIIMCNQAAMKLYGYTDKEELLKDFFSLTPAHQPNGENSDKKYEQYIAKAESEGECSFEFVRLSKQKEEIPCLITLTRVDWNNSHRVVAYTRDLRAEKAHLAEMARAHADLEMALIKAEESTRAKSDFLARMSHEIRTPMNSIIGVSELMLRRDYSQEVIDYMTIISQSGRNLLAIINNILDYSKIESGQYQIVPVSYDVPSILFDVVNMTRARLLGSDLTFVVNVDSKIPYFLIGDAQHIRQILLNLLGNAAKYTRVGSIEFNVILDEMTDDTAKIIFQVKDTGVGIKDDDMEKLFEVFTRLDAVEQSHIEGSGLGLSIAGALANAMDGKIEVESTYGEGSTFAFTVEQKIDKYSEIASVEDAKKYHVLLFDENVSSGLSIQLALDNLGVSNIRTFNIDDFFLELSTDKYDFAFLSINHKISNDKRLAGKKGVTELIGIAELDDTAPYDLDIRFVQRPLYCTVIADILNGDPYDSESSFSKQDNSDLLSAPEAHVLIVDDMYTNLRVTKELMILYDMKVDIAESGREAIKLVKQNQYDIVFMDHMMPEMDGVEATSLIRGLDSPDERYEKLPIIALTANALTGSREFFLDNKMNDFLAKPIEMSKLTRILEKWLDPEKQHAQKRVIRETQESELPDLGDVDTKVGLRNVGGSIPAYIDIVEDFCRGAQDRADDVKTSLENGDIKRYRVLVHALKGATRSIGAQQFAFYAETMENAAKDEDLDAMHAHTAGLLLSLEHLVSDIEDGIAKYRDGEDIADGTDAIRNNLIALRQALLDEDIQKINELLLTFSGLVKSANDARLVAAIEDDILMMDYEIAIDKIDEALK